MNPRISARLSRWPSTAGNPPHGFTLVELLVVITIIAMLAGLLLPAIMSAREAGRRATCMNNQKQIGTAITVYVTQKDQFPPSFSLQPNNPSPRWADQFKVGWVPPLLPFMEQNTWYQVYQSNSWWSRDASNQPIFKDATINLLVCPSRARGITTPAPLSYVVNCGMPDPAFPAVNMATNTLYPMDWQENGVFFDAFMPAITDPAKVNPPFFKNKVPPTTTDLTFISRHDGNSTTLLFSENLDAMDWIGLLTTPPDYAPIPWPAQPGKTWWQGMVWSVPNDPNTYQAASWANFLMRSNKGEITASTGRDGVPGLPPSSANLSVALPSSNHPGGFLATMCDGHTVFLSQEMEHRVYCLLMAPDNANAKFNFKQPGTSVVYPTSWPLVLTDNDVK